MAKHLTKSTYNTLLSNIDKIYQASFKKINTLVAEVYRLIGKQIVTVEQKNNIRAQYGEQLLEKLSKDLTRKYGKGFSVSNLRNMRSFYLENPIRQPVGELGWTKEIILLSVEDPKKRKELKQKSVKNKVSVRTLRKLVKASGGGDSKKVVTTPPQLKYPTNLVLSTYTRVENSVLTAGKNEIIVDCGFFVLKNVSNKTKTAKKSSYTYSAQSERVVDGDTLKVFIDVGFGTIVNQRLRLRGINTPELNTKEGARAKRFVQRRLKPGDTIIIKTHSTDIYGRFVTDVLYLPGSKDPIEIIQNGIYLNQELLNKGMAQRL